MYGSWNLDNLYVGFDDPKFLGDFEALPMAIKSLVDYANVAFR